MGCNQSRKDYSFSEQEVKKIREFFLKNANSYIETKDKNELCIQAFREIFEENQILGERLYDFMLKNSTSGKVDFDIFIDVLELLLRNPSNTSLGKSYLKHDKVGLLCAILFPHMRKGFKKDQYMNLLINYSEGFDLILCILHMLNGSPNQKVNDSHARTIVDRVFQNNDTKLEFWTFGVLIKEQMNLISSFIQIYFKNKFLDGTVSFILPSMPDLSKQILINKDSLLQLYLNNNYLLNSQQVKLLYQATQDDYNFDSLASQLQNFVGETFILLQFKDNKGNKYTVGGFNPLKWGQLGNDSAESYIFSLSPRYRHCYPVLDQFNAKPVFNQYCYLNTQESYGRQIGLVFGLNHEDCRIWIDGKSLKNSAVKNSEKFFKKGALIPPNAENPVCTLIEVYGVHTDQAKKTYTYSSINNTQLNQILAGSRDLRNSLTMGIDANRSSNIGFNKSPYSSNIQTTTTTTYKTDNYDERVKKSGPPPSNNINSIKTSDSLYAPQGYTTTAYSSYTAPQTNYQTTSVPDYKSMYVPQSNYTYSNQDQGRYSSTQYPSTYTYTSSTQERKTTVN